MIRFALINSGSPVQPDQARLLHLGLETTADGTVAGSSPVHLLVLDTRRMNAACLKSAFAEAQRLRLNPGFKHGVLACAYPLLALVQAAIRVGLTDIIHEPLTGQKLVQLLRTATPNRRTCSKQLASLGAILRILAAGNAPDSPSTQLTRREYALTQRAEQLTHIETRLTLERAALEEREQQLRTSIRRLERDFAAQQKDSDISPTTSASPFAPDLQALAALLAERAKALDIRERMLQEMESLLIAQAAESFAQHSAA